MQEAIDREQPRYEDKCRRPEEEQCHEMQLCRENSETYMLLMLTPVGGKVPAGNYRSNDRN